MQIISGFGSCKKGEEKSPCVSGKLFSIFENTACLLFWVKLGPGFKGGGKSQYSRVSLAEAPLQLSNFYNEQWDDDGDNDDAESDDLSIEIYHAYSFHI